MPRYYPLWRVCISLINHLTYHLFVASTLGLGYLRTVTKTIQTVTSYITPSLYADYDLTPPAASNSTQYKQNWATGAAAAGPCVATNLTGTPNPDRGSAYWKERDIVARAAASKVPTFWAHGFNDVNTKPDQIFGVYGPLNDKPKSNHRAWFGQWAHDRGNEVGKVGRAGFLEESMDWFDHYLKGQPFRYSVNAANVTEIQDNEGAWRTEAQYPPKDVQSFRFPLRTGSYADDGSSTAGYWTASQPGEKACRITGEP